MQSRTLGHSFQRPDNAATQVVVTFYVVTIGHP
jgi:hypothetical protein